MRAPLKASILTPKPRPPKGQQAPVPRYPTSILQQNRNTALHTSRQATQSLTEFMLLLFFNHKVMFKSSLPHWLQHIRVSCPLPPPRVCPNSCPLHWLCHPAISSSVALFSFCPSIFPAPRSFPMNWLFTSGGQNIGASTSASVLPMNFQGWCPLGLTSLISLLSKELSRVFYSNTVQKHQFFSIHSSLWSSSHNVHDYWKDFACLL